MSSTRLSRVPSSQLLSPEPQRPTGPPTGTRLVAEVKRTARARMMGIPALRRDYPTVGELMSSNKHSSAPTPVPGSGHGGSKLNSNQHGLSNCLTTPPPRFNRRANRPRLPPSSSALIFPALTSSNHSPSALPDFIPSHPTPVSSPSQTLEPRLMSPLSERVPRALSAHSKDLITPQADIPVSGLTPPRLQIPSVMRLHHAIQAPIKSRTSIGHIRLLSPDRPKLREEEKEKDKDKGTEEDVDSSSDLEITPTASTPPHRPSAEILLYSRDSPRSRRYSPSAVHGNLSQENASSRTPLASTLSREIEDVPIDFASLLSLHSALERALLLHLATEGGGAAMKVISRAPALTSPPVPTKNLFSQQDRMKTPEPEEFRPPTGPADLTDGFKTFRLENLVSWPVVRPIVERGSGKRFGPRELAQLLWLWQNDPSDDQKPRSCYPTDPVPVTEGEQTGMGFIISRVRVLKGGALKKQLSYTYGIGIEINVRENPQLPTYSLQSPSKSVLSESPTRPPRRSPTALREGMNLIALWSSRADERKAEIGRRLHAHWLSQNKPLSGDNNASPVDKLIPLAALPCLNPGKPRVKQSNQAPLVVRPIPFPSHDSHNKRVLPKDALSSREKSPLICSEQRCAKRPRQQLDSHSKLISGDRTSASDSCLIRSSRESAVILTNATSTERRALSLMERIKAKEAAKNQIELSELFKDDQQTEDSGTGSPTRTEDSTLTRFADLRKKSMLSRLPEVIEGIYMIFVPDFSSVGPSSSLPNRPTKKKPAMMIDDLAQLITKSSRISLSTGEATGLIKLLIELCPDFLILKSVAGDDWVMVPSETNLINRQIITNVKEVVRKTLLSTK